MSRTQRRRGGRAPIPAPAPMTFRPADNTDTILARIDATLASWDTTKKETRIN